ncbi:MAG TPA: tetratricopeptide repeat protein [Candidatus Dormibacteraeota bacterium]|nr:tetratricopeptide repeat protein [Candidatus Dormibacteraeota bacterium]
MASHPISLAIVFCAFMGVCSATNSQPLVPQAGQVDRVGPAQARAKHSQILLVFPFENAGRVVRLDWLGEGLEELTIERMAAGGERLLTHEERVAALEKSGLPASTRFSRATMLKIAEDLDADFVVFGSYGYDGKNLNVSARLLRVNPPRLLNPVVESGPLADLMDSHLRLSWRLLKEAEPAFAFSREEFAKLQRPVRLDAFEHYVRGMLANDDEQRIRSLREAARLEPNWVAPDFALGQAYFVRRDCDDALVWFARVPASHERGLEATFYSGVCYLQRNDPTRAAASFASVRLAPTGRSSREANWHADIPEAINNLGIALERLGKINESEKELKRAIQLDPEDADYWFNLALVGIRNNNPSPSIEPLRQLLRREPEDSEARALLIAALERSGRANDAAAERAVASQEVGAKPLPVLKPEVLARLARIKTHFDASALRQFAEIPVETADARTAIASASAGRQLRLKRAKQLLTAAKFVEAQKEYSAILVNSPRDPAAHQGMAEIYRRQGRVDDAVTELRTSLEIRDDAAARTTLARLYIEGKKTDAAREQLQLALKLAPSYAEARALLDKLPAKSNAKDRR